MVKYIISVLYLLSLYSCTPPFREVYLVPDLGWETAEDVVRWVYLNINYVSDEGGDFWKYPHETWVAREGDCEDYSILVAYICETYLDIPTNILVSDSHVWVECNSIQWEPQTGAVVHNNVGYYKILYRYPYGKINKLIAHNR